MSILCDFHLHSDFSGDSDTPASAMIQRAGMLGLEEICFTEHLDIDAPEDGPDFSLNFEAYFSSMEKLQRDYGDKIRTCAGMEFGIMPHLTKELTRLNRTYPFDFIIASLHYVNGKDPYYPSYFEGRDERECYEEYFREELNTLKCYDPRDFDTLGHMDYIVRYGPSRNKNYSYEAYSDLIDPILIYLIENGKCLELNTGGYKSGLDEPNPCAGIFRRYHELGGELITIGSDAHTPEYVGYAFDRARKLLSSLGFRYYTVIEHRKMRQLGL